MLGKQKAIQKVRQKRANSESKANKRQIQKVGQRKVNSESWAKKCKFRK